MSKSENHLILILYQYSVPIWYNINYLKLFLNICIFYYLVRPKTLNIPILTMRRDGMLSKKIVILVVVTALLFSTIAISTVFSNIETDEGISKEFSWEGDDSQDAGICGGGDLPGPGGPQ